MTEITRIKIGRHEYTITTDDRFLDNGACIQLLTQSKERSSWGRRPNPVLSKRAVKEISAYLLENKTPSPYYEGVYKFSLGTLSTPLENKTV